MGKVEKKVTVLFLESLSACRWCLHVLDLPFFTPFGSKIKMPVHVCRTSTGRFCALLRCAVRFMAWTEPSFTSGLNEVTLNAFFQPSLALKTLLRTYGELSVRMLTCHLTNQSAHLHANCDVSIRACVSVCNQMHMLYAVGCFLLYRFRMNKANTCQLCIH